MIQKLLLNMVLSNDQNLHVGIVWVTFMTPS